MVALAPLRALAYGLELRDAARELELGLPQVGALGGGPIGDRPEPVRRRGLPPLGRQTVSTQRDALAALGELCGNVDSGGRIERGDRTDRERVQRSERDVLRVRQPLPQAGVDADRDDKHRLRCELAPGIDQRARRGVVQIIEHEQRRPSGGERQRHGLRAVQHTRPPSVDLAGQLGRQPCPADADRAAQHGDTAVTA